MKMAGSFKSRLLGLQGNLLSFAYQLTTNREEAPQKPNFLRSQTFARRTQGFQMIDHI